MGLQGLKVLVLRGPDEAEALLGEIAGRGAEVRAIAPLAPWPLAPSEELALRQALRQLPAADCLVFTSARAVRVLAGLLEAEGMALAPDRRVATVGPATSEAVRRVLGVVPDLEAPEGEAKSLGQLLAKAFPQPSRFWWPRNAAAEGAWVEGLEALGHQVVAPVAYAMHLAEAEALREALVWAEAVVAYSPAGLRAAAKAWRPLGTGQLPPWGVAIGPSTAKALRAWPGGCRAVALRPTDLGILLALEEAFSSLGG